MPPAGVTFRPITSEDRDFLADLYASTRREELAPVPWSPEQKEAFLRQQFEAQHAHYQEHYPDCEFSIVLVDGELGGRLYVDRREETIRVVDIALLPGHRGRGIGGALLQELQQEAAASKRTLSIHVEHNNPALSLYRRLGFQHVDTNGVYHLMEWSAEEIVPP